MLESSRAGLPARRPLPADRRPAARHRAPVSRARTRPEGPGPPGRDRHGQRPTSRCLGHPGAPEADARAGPQQDPGGPAVQRVPRLLPPQRGRVLRQLLRLLPARGLPAAQRHVHREGLVAQRRDRQAAPRRDPRPLRAPRRDHRGQRQLHLRPRRARRLRRDRHPPAGRRAISSRRRAAPAGGPAVPAQRPGAQPGPLPRSRRHPGGPAGLRRLHRAGAVLRR